MFADFGFTRSGRNPRQSKHEDSEFLPTEFGPDGGALPKETDIHDTTAYQALTSDGPASEGSGGYARHDFWLSSAQASEFRRDWKDRGYVEPVERVLEG